MSESDTPDNKFPMFKIGQNLEASKGKHKSQPTESNSGPRGQKGKSPYALENPEARAQTQRKRSALSARLVPQWAKQAPASIYIRSLSIS